MTLYVWKMHRNNAIYFWGPYCSFSLWNLHLHLWKKGSAEFSLRLLKQEVWFLSLIFQQTLNPQAKKNDLSYYNASDASISNQCIAAASEYCESAKSTTVGDFIAFKSKVLFKNFWLTWRCNLFLVRSHSHLIVRKNQIWEVKTVYYLDSNIEY